MVKFVCSLCSALKPSPRSHKGSIYVAKTLFTPSNIFDIKGASPLTLSVKRDRQDMLEPLMARFVLLHVILPLRACAARIIIFNLSAKRSPLRLARRDHI